MNVQPMVVTQPPMVVTVQPNRNYWQTNLCDCFSDCGVWVLADFRARLFSCTCFLTQIGNIISATTASLLVLKMLSNWIMKYLKENKEAWKASRTQQFKCFCGLFCFPCMACQVASDMNECCFCGPTVAMRSVYRTKYGIPGSICDDTCVVWCFPVCSLCQIKRDINRRKDMGIF